MQKRYLSALVIATSASLCVSSANAAGLSSTALKNATAFAPDMGGEGTHPLKFRNGAHKNGSGTDKILHTAVGDLNGDGLDDGAIVFYEEWGGSGAFMRMSVFLCKNGRPVQIGSRTLGDRSDTKSLKINKKVLTLDIMTHGPEDSANSPTVHKVINFHVKKGKLIGPDDINM